MATRRCSTAAPDNRETAPLSRRFLAQTLDGLLLLPPALLLRRFPRQPSTRSRGVALIAADALYTVGFVGALGQTPGQMAAGVSVVDRRSGRPPTWRQAIVRWLVSTLVRQVSKRFVPPIPPADVERVRTLKNDIQRLELEHGDDQQRLNEELLDLYGRFGGSPAKGLGRVALSLFGELTDLVIILLDPLRRGLNDRAAGTIVVSTLRQ
jgi:uncharacterized RDD family membrane protein YckC